MKFGEKCSTMRIFFFIISTFHLYFYRVEHFDTMIWKIHVFSWKSAVKNLYAANVRKLNAVHVGNTVCIKLTTNFNLHNTYRILWFFFQRQIFGFPLQFESSQMATLQIFDTIICALLDVSLLWDVKLKSRTSRFNFFFQRMVSAG